MAIRSFSERALELFFLGGPIPRRAGWRSVAKIALRKMDMIAYAEILSDLASPPGNRLEALKGSLEGFHSIRVNDQWRIVFRWTDLGATDVAIIDYH